MQVLSNACGNFLESIEYFAKEVSMNLKKFLILNDFPVGELAKKMKAERTHLSAVINGQRRLTDKMAQRIEDATDGKLKKEELLKLSKQPKR